MNNKKIEPKKAAARERVKKIFCGGFGPEVNEEELQTHFSQFGEIEKIEIPMKDQEKKLHKVSNGPNGAVPVLIRIRFLPFI